MENVFDFAVIGAGPAGCVFAHLTAGKYTLFVLDRPKCDGGFEKPCGGLLNPDAVQALAALGLTVPEDVYVSPKPTSVRVISVDTGAECAYARNYINTDRHGLDLWFRSLVPSQAVLCEGTYVRYEKQNGLFKVYYRENGADKTVLARALVGADGGGSLVRRQTFPKDTMRRYTAVQEWYHEEKPSGYACVFDPETTDCCAWSISKNGMLVYGGAFPSDGCKERFEKHIKKMSLFGYDLTAPVKREACVVFRPKRLSDIKLSSDGVYLLGEAAGFISPSSLEGISFAVNSASALAQAVGSDKPEKAYKNNTKYLRKKIYVRLRKVPFMYNPLLRFFVMKSKLTSIR